MEILILSSFFCMPPFLSVLMTLLSVRSGGVVDDEDPETNPDPISALW